MKGGINRMIKFKDLSSWLKFAVIAAWIYSGFFTVSVIAELFWTWPYY